MGQPVTLKAYHSSNREPTQGTETSKYLEEKKIIMIPQVVASEKGGMLMVAEGQRLPG